MSIPELAAQLGVSRTMVYRMASEGRLPFVVRVQKRWLVLRKKLGELMANPAAFEEALRPRPVGRPRRIPDAG